MESVLFWAREITASAFFLLSIVFGLGGVIGLHRFPDAWSRLQGGSLVSTTSIFSLMIGALALSPNWEMASRILIILGFFMISSPTGSHIIARVLWERGIPHWKPEGTE